MNDDVRPPDTPSDQLEAVSAVIDGTATDDQQALVDATPGLVSLLDELRTNRRAMAEVDVPAALRDAHLATALAAFDDLHDAPGSAAAAAGAGAGTSDTAAATSSNVVSLDRRRRMYRSLMGAAAAVVLVIAGVAALGSLGGGSDDESASLATESPKAGSDVAAAAEVPAAAAAATDSPADDATADAEAPLSVEASTARTEAATDSGETAAPAETTAAAEPPRPTIGSIGVGGAQAAPPISDEQQLADYVATATPNADAAPGTAPCVPAGDENLGNISYQGTLAVVVRDTRSDQITVYATEGCEPLLTLPA